MKKPSVFRKRFIPSETVDISGDELVFRDDDLVITKWKVIRPRVDIDRGISFAFLKEGYKISKFYDPQGKFVYWYCDIIDVEYDEKSDTYTLIDLLVDVKIMPDGSVRVLDIDEIADALEGNIITKELAIEAMRKLDRLLKIIYEGNFPPEVCRREEYNLV
jgi:predicted RNA-binding protein associated with RNAse of E/G family